MDCSTTGVTPQQQHQQLLPTPGTQPVKQQPDDDAIKPTLALAKKFHASWARCSREALAVIQASKKHKNMAGIQLLADLEDLVTAVREHDDALLEFERDHASGGDTIDALQIKEAVESETEIEQAIKVARRKMNALKALRKV